MSMASDSREGDRKSILADAARLFREGDLEASERLYKKASQFAESAADAYFGIGGIFLKRKNYTAAIEAFTQCLQRSTRNSKACSFLGEAWEQRGSLETALGFYRGALQINPDHRGAQHKIYVLSKPSSHR